MVYQQERRLWTFCQKRWTFGTQNPPNHWIHARLGLTRFITGMLFGVGLLDPAPFLAAGAAFLLVGFVACALTALRYASILLRPYGMRRSVDTPSERFCSKHTFCYT